MLAGEGSGSTRLRMLGKPSTFYSRKRHDNIPMHEFIILLTWHVTSSMLARVCLLRHTILSSQLICTALVDRSLSKVANPSKTRLGLSRMGLNF